MYRLLGRLETGDLSELFRAEHDDQPVVVKLFHSRTTDAAYARVVADVAKQLRPVSHRGIAQVHRVGLAGTRLAIVREGFGRFTLGQALIRLNTREVILPPAVALSVMLELLEAVEAGHQAGVMHGALTPGNVLLAENGAVGVADFGALAALQASATLRRAFAGKGRGSYRAPELAASSSATVASDVFALGALMYELLTLREASSGAPALSVRRERLVAPSRLVRTLNGRIDAAVMRALETDPHRRFASCEAFSTEVRAYLATNGGVPSAADRQNFVGALFPKDVVLGALGPVPFDTFEISDITGVLELDAELAEVASRRPFSSDRAATEPEIAVAPWDAGPAAIASEPAPASQHARVAIREPKPALLQREPVAREEPKDETPHQTIEDDISHAGPRPARRTIASPTTPDGVSPTRRIAPLAAGVLIIVAVFAALLWASRGPPQSNGCYQAPAAGAAYVQLRGAPIGAEVEIDDLRVCTNPASRIGVAPGLRHITVTHPKTGRRSETSAQLEPGKQVSISVVFK